MFDPLDLASSPKIQLATVRAGWRYTLRVAQREESQQALGEWVDALDAVLALGRRPAELVEFLEVFPVAVKMAREEGLKARIQDIWAQINQLS